MEESILHFQCQALMKSFSLKKLWFRLIHLTWTEICFCWLGCYPVKYCNKVLQRENTKYCSIYESLEPECEVNCLCKSKVCDACLICNQHRMLKLSNLSPLGYNFLYHWLYLSLVISCQVQMLFFFSILEFHGHGKALFSHCLLLATSFINQLQIQ